jgi:hypothetical protein
LCLLQVWAALTDEQRRDKETFYSGQQRTASGFMRYANTTLELLITLTGDRDIVSDDMGGSTSQAMGSSTHRRQGHRE